METLFFILGIASVVVIATAIVAVVSIIKVTKLQTKVKDDFGDVYRSFDNVFNSLDFKLTETHDNVGRLNEEVTRRVDTVESHFTSQLDSRIDKLASKTDKSIEDLHRIFSDYINNKKK